MVNLTIDKLPVSVKEGTTLMEAAESIGIHIPHLCYWKGLNLSLIHILEFYTGNFQICRCSHYNS